MARLALAALLLALVVPALPKPAMAQFAPSAPKASAKEVPCNSDGTVPVQGIRKGSSGPGQQPDLLIDRDCKAQGANTYYFGTVRIINKGTLRFVEPPTASKVNFWANNIIIENGGTLMAGTATAPYGSRGSVLTIYLYGSDQSLSVDPTVKPGQGALCHGLLNRQAKDDKDKTGPCGIPWAVWSDNGKSPNALNGTPEVGGVTDYFYQYGPMYGDNLCDGGAAKWTADVDKITKQPILCGTKASVDVQVGYFGYKVLGVSYGATLQLFGYKGTPLTKARRYAISAALRASSACPDYPAPRPPMAPHREAAAAPAPRTDIASCSSAAGRVEAPAEGRAAAPAEAWAAVRAGMRKTTAAWPQGRRSTPAPRRIPIRPAPDAPGCAWRRI